MARFRYRYTWVDIRGREMTDSFFCRPEVHGPSCMFDDLDRIHIGRYDEHEHVFRAPAVEEVSA